MGSYMLKCKNFKKTKRKDVTFHKLCDIIVVNKYGTISWNCDIVLKSRERNLKLWTTTIYSGREKELHAKLQEKDSLLHFSQWQRRSFPSSSQK